MFLVASAAGWVSRLIGRPLCVRWAAARPRDRHTRVCGSERSISRPALALPSEPGPPSPEPGLPLLRPGPPSPEPGLPLLRPVPPSVEPGPVAASAWPCSQVTLSIEARLVFLSVASQGLLAALRTCGSSVATISLRIETVAACVGVSWHRIETAGTSVAEKWQLLVHFSPTEAVRVSCGFFDASTEVSLVSSSGSTVPTEAVRVSCGCFDASTEVSLVSSSGSTVPTVVSLVSCGCSDASTEVQSVSSSRSTVPTVVSLVSSSRSAVPPVTSRGSRAARHIPFTPTANPCTGWTRRTRPSHGQAYPFYPDRPHRAAVRCWVLTAYALDA